MTGNLQREAKAERRVQFAAGILRTAMAPSDVTRLGAAIACSLAASVLAATAPVALKYLLEALTLEGAEIRPSVLPAVPIFWLAAYVGALFGGRLAGEVRSALFGHAEQSVSRNLSRRAFAHVMALPMRFHLGRSTGAVVQTLENGLQGYRLVLQHSLFTVLPGLVEIALIAALVVHFFDAVFLLVFAAGAAAYTVVFSDGARRILRASRAVSEARIEASARLSDGLLNCETVKAFGGEETI
ncbi:MAG: ABC transporter transmembrane domain-containing protein, partial [Hyphomonas sp.]|nr:ABC transporter transmembrane domain-containing protein [Hyphomonas sp.]